MRRREGVVVDGVGGDSSSDVREEWWESVNPFTSQEPIRTAASRRRMPSSGSMERRAQPMMALRADGVTPRRASFGARGFAFDLRLIRVPTCAASTARGIYGRDWGTRGSFSATTIAPVKGKA